jgi:polyphosphate kinase 2 (PPK2 family)
MVRCFPMELCWLQVELVKLQEWVRLEGVKVVVIFENHYSGPLGDVLLLVLEKPKKGKKLRIETMK